MITKKQQKFKRSKCTQTQAYDVELILEKFGHWFHIFLRPYEFSKFKSFSKKKNKNFEQ